MPSLPLPMPFAPQPVTIENGALVVDGTRRRYIEAYETLTGRAFHPAAG